MKAKTIITPKSLILKYLGAIRKRNLFKPEKVFHYTTIEAFYGIIGKNELWLSERNCMNDIYDEFYIKDIVKQMLTKRHPDLFRGTYFDTHFISDKPQCVFSTSTERDVAHQWLNYGNNNAICIVFDTKKLKTFFLSIPAWNI